MNFSVVDGSADFPAGYIHRDAYWCLCNSVTSPIVCATNCVHATSKLTVGASSGSNGSNTCLIDEALQFGWGG